MFFTIFIIFVILQRITELVIAKRNEKKLFSLGAVEYDKGGYKVIVLMHTLFFLSLIAEYILCNREVSSWWQLLIFVFILTQILRYWALKSLGEFWNTRIIILEGSKLIKKGPYRFISHPNYAAVVIELLVIPLLFSCYITAVVFTVLNIVVLKRRIGIENTALAKLKEN